MANKVLLKKSSVGARVPTTSDLDYGELALNYADGKLFYKTSSNTIKSFTDDTSVVTLTGTQTLTNKTLTSPAVTTSLTTGSTSFDLVNTTATTVNAFGAATALNLGAATGTTTVGNRLKLSRTNSTAAGTGQILLDGSNGNRIDWNTEGVAAPTFTTRSVGTKLTLYPTLSESQADYAIGINSGTFWNSIPGNDAGQFFKWYGGTTEVASLSGTGNLTALGNITASGDVLGAYIRSTNSQGDEGGEILLYKPQTNTAIAGTGVTIDIYQNKIRFFEQGGSARGAYIDISAAGAGVSSSLLSGGATVNSFSTIAVSGQTSVAADSSTDTLTLVAGEGITLTTNATTDSITITGSGGYNGLVEISQTGISSSTTLNTASATTYRGAKYTIQITNGSAYAMYEFVVMHDGTNVYFPYNTNVYAGDASGNFQSYFSGDYLDSLASLKIQVGNTFHALNWSVTGGNLVFSASCSSGTISVKGTALLIKA